MGGCINEGQEEGGMDFITENIEHLSLKLQLQMSKAEPQSASPQQGDITGPRLAAGWTVLPLCGHRTSLVNVFISP